VSFTGFPPAALALPARLPSLDTADFAAGRADWEQRLLQPARHFVNDLGILLGERIFDRPHRLEAEFLEEPAILRHRVAPLGVVVGEELRRCPRPAIPW
jgi:hypothetical protein